MKIEKELLPMRLQFFAEDGDTDPEDSGEDTGDTDQEEDSGDEEEKTFTQEDLDKAIAKRLARERRKWDKDKEKETKKPDETKKADDTKADSEDIIKRKEAEQKAEALETKLLCYEQGVDKDSVDDVVALAQVHVNVDTDIEDAIEKVLKKYPQFKATNGEEDDKKPSISAKINKNKDKDNDPFAAKLAKYN